MIAPTRTKSDAPDPTSTVVVVPPVLELTDDQVASLLRAAIEADDDGVSKPFERDSA